MCKYKFLIESVRKNIIDEIVLKFFVNEVNIFF